MPRTTPLQTNFTSGELSPRLRARVNWEKYPNGVSELQNFIVMPHGPVRKRPGSKFIAEVKESAKKTRLVPFRFSTTQTYVIEFGDKYIRFYTAQGQIESAPGTPYEIVSPYVTADLFELFFIQSADVIFIFHSDYPPQLLTRYAHDLWSIAAAPYRGGPFLEWNSTETAIVPTGRTGSIYIYISPPPGVGGEFVTNGSFEPVLGAELISNGDFAVAAGWTYNGTWQHDGGILQAARVAAAPYDCLGLNQVTAATAIPHKVTYDIAATNGYPVVVTLDDAQTTPRFSAGSYVDYLTPTGIGGVFGVVPSLYFTGYVDNISVKPCTADVSWTWGANWSHQIALKTADHAAGSTAKLEQTIAAVADDYVVVKFTVSNRTAGTVTPSVGTTSGTAISSNIVSQQVIKVAGGAPVKLAFVPSNTFDGSISEVSCSLLGSTGLALTADHVGAYIALKQAYGTPIYYGYCSNPCIFTSISHGLATGDVITIMGFTQYPGGYAGWTPLNGLQFAVTVLDTNMFSIPYNATSFPLSIVNSGAYWFKTYGGYVQITAVYNAYFAAATVISTLSSYYPTYEWAEGAWSGAQGYPRAAAIHDERMVCAGTTMRPQTMWGSVVGDYGNFAIGADDDDAFNYTVASGELDAVQWMLPLEVLLVGTASKVMRVASSDQEGPLTPTNFSIKPSVSYGSADMPGIVTGESVLYFDRMRRRLRELAYNYEKGFSGGFVSQDMTLLSEHITSPGISAMDWSQSPDQIIWCVRDDGVLVGMTYERAQTVVAWHRHVTDGDVESIAVIPGTLADELWMVVERTIGGGTKRYVELIDLGDVPDDIEDCFFVDCGLSYDGAPADVMSGLDHLEGETVSVLADGTIHASRVVTGGTITLDAHYSKVHVGLPYECRLETLPIEAGAAEGSAQGKIKRFHQVGLMVEKSSELKLGDGTYEADVEDSWTDQTLITPFPGGFDIYGQMLLTQNAPTPVIIKGIAPRIVTSDS